MIYASYKCEGKVYSVVPAKITDINADMKFALQDGVEVDDDYRSRMEESVKQNLAYRITRSGEKIGVLYNAVIGGEYMGCSIYCKEDRIGMMIMMKTIFEVYDWYKIKVMPHTDGLKYFVSMATPSSIREYHNRGTALTILKKNVVANGEKVFRYLGIEVL